MLYIGMILIALVGTFLHFLYELSGHNKFVAIFAAVNESTWEHIKICMTPTILWSLYDGYVYGINSNYFIAKATSLLVIILVIPLLFYSYTLITKKSILWVDVICFYVTVICSQLVFNYIININSFVDKVYLKQNNNISENMLKSMDGSIGKSKKIIEKHELYEEIDSLKKNIK